MSHNTTIDPKTEPSGCSIARLKSIGQPALAEIRFEDPQPTSFAGLVVFQPLVERLALTSRLRGCFEHLKASPIFGHASIVMRLIVHLLIGYRRLSDLRDYHHDPMVRRTPGLKRLPEVATVSRTLDGMHKTAVGELRSLSRSLVLDPQKVLAPARLTVEFDGSVPGTTRMAEGTAVGYQSYKKGQRSYYPLFCTVAQTGQVLDVWHRPGNGHDSNGARAFILACLNEIRQIPPRVTLEARIDCAIFSEEIVRALDALGIQYTIRVPFERLTQLRRKIEKRHLWHRADRHGKFFECYWKPSCWAETRRFLCIRTREPKQRKGPLQLNEYGHQFKVILTNATLSARKLLALHPGRGAQEAIFAELKSPTQMDYIPCRRRAVNQTWLLPAIMAHNLNRELQMSSTDPARATTEQRAPWGRSCVSAPAE